MFKTEIDYLQDILFDGDELRKNLLDVIRKVEFVAYRYTNKDGKYYLNNAFGDEIETVGDTEGNYAYIRYTDSNGNHQMRENTLSVRLTMVVCLPNCGADAIKVGLKLMNFLKESKVGNCKVLNLSPLRSNRKEIWVQETNGDAERFRNDLSIIAFDFDLQFSQPNDCDFNDYQISNC